MPPNAPDVAAAAAPEQAKKPAETADYAAVAPPQAPGQTASRRARRAKGRAANAAVARTVVADAEMESAANSSAVAAAAEEARDSAIPAPAPAGASMAAVGAARRAEAPAQQEVLADSVADGRKAKMAVASRFAKDKVVLAADNAATAHVADKPMPATLAINPAPVGGSAALRDHIRREAAGFEPESNAAHLSGTVRVKFVVGADGKVSSLKVIHGLRADYDAEALRIVCEGPAWQPGVANGRRAPLPMEVTVPF